VDNTMRASLHITALTALTLIASSALAIAAEVRVLSVGSTQIAAKVIAAEFEKQTGHKVTFTIRPPFDIDKELAAKTFDTVILSVPAMDNRGRRACQARNPRRGQGKDAPRHGRSRRRTGRQGWVELGFFNLSEIPKGVIVAGALPGPLQGYTVYEAAVLSKGSTDQAATAFVKYLASAPAAAHWSEAKLEPAATYMRTRASQWFQHDLSVRQVDPSMAAQQSRKPLRCHLTTLASMTCQTR
jgi:hypothetical protein